ncbi:biotin transporter BioY [Tumebacillus algifaecis]|uniref:Biotin transporter n=1 Tax=Tumebacillus algifaecis TaxID=1214604 RepID=A0A223D4P3_9BACL|nr:biotin transporter BioY [Tumebacillus algifaecis]ASS76324.1 biotin transporter BioY [Tumebacillus algifaecis]
MGVQSSVRGVVFSALFAALLVVLSYVNINLGFSPVPITLSNMAILFAGVLLGPFYGFFSMALVVVLTLFGLPMWHGNGGIGLVAGPTGGFIVMYPVAAFLVGLVAKRITGSGVFAHIQMLFVTFVFGFLVLYLGGVPWLKSVADLTWQSAMIAGFYPFWPGDLAKAVVASLIILQVRRVYPAERLVGQGGSKVVTLK